jgi:hypothetical protein
MPTFAPVDRDSVDESFAFDFGGVLAVGVLAVWALVVGALAVCVDPGLRHKSAHGLQPLGEAAILQAIRSREASSRQARQVRNGYTG